MSPLLKTPKLDRVPPLENGDRLTRAEFERRYAAMPPNIKAELIDGVVSVASPVRIRHHGSPHVELVAWAGIFRVYTPGVLVGGNATVRLDKDSEAQPDVCILIEHGGQAQVDADGYVEAAPEFVAEVAASTASYDRGVKLSTYCRCGVREYLVWRVLDQAIDWFAWREGQYEPLPAGPDGIIRSEIFPGLWLDAAALIRGELPRVHEVLHQGLASAAHADFVKSLGPSASSHS